MWYIWLIASLVFFFTEAITVGFLIFWLGIGALLTMVLSFFVQDLIIQCVFFLMVSTALIFLTKPLVNKVINSQNSIATNAYSIISKKGIVISDIVSSESIGQVKIGSETWSAVSEDEAPISKGTEVTILRIDGVKVVVK